MHRHIYIIPLLFWTMLSCSTKEDQQPVEEPYKEESLENVVRLTTAQFNAMEMIVDSISLRNLSSVVQTNGELEVPPQNEATVTAVIGANVTSIEVIEGEDVDKGQILAYLSHPNIISVQGEYLKVYNQLQFLEQEFQRQKKLYEQEVGAGKTFQQTKADYLAAQANLKSMAAQLRQLGLNPATVQNGNIIERVPVRSPIEGTVVKVEVKTGQYVQPEKDLFEIVNTHHIHADLMVFEKDVFKVKEGQRVRFTIEMLPDQELYAEIYSVGKKFEQDPKAVHVHAEIENKTGNLIPGMYIKGEILTDSITTPALPESAVVRQGDDFFVFMVISKPAESHPYWVFAPVPVKAGLSSNNWVAINFLEDVPDNTEFAYNQAYYLLAEMGKDEAGHDH
ncbi:MAG: efflux RND transporter periplasmic adaptor subunit [Candidatus Cyclobacteriaceae bacterium M2_1C_046]